LTTCSAGSTLHINKIRFSLGEENGERDED
jgi:hypothetical protein